MCVCMAGCTGVCVHVGVHRGVCMGVPIVGGVYGRGAQGCMRWAHAWGGLHMAGTHTGRLCGGLHPGAL